MLNTALHYSNAIPIAALSLWWESECAPNIASLEDGGVCCRQGHVVCVPFLTSRSDLESLDSTRLIKLFRSSGLVHKNGNVAALGYADGTSTAEMYMKPWVWGRWFRQAMLNNNDISKAPEEFVDLLTPVKSPRPMAAVPTTPPDIEEHYLIVAYLEVWVGEDAGQAYEDMTRCTVDSDERPALEWRDVSVAPDDNTTPLSELLEPLDHRTLRAWLKKIRKWRREPSSPEALNGIFSPCSMDTALEVFLAANIINGLRATPDMPENAVIQFAELEQPEENTYTMLIKIQQGSWYRLHGLPPYTVLFLSYA